MIDDIKEIAKAFIESLKDERPALRSTADLART